MIYKIVPAALWREAETAGRFTGSAVDERDGFIHCSTAAQVRQTFRPLPIDASGAHDFPSLDRPSSLAVELQQRTETP